MAHELNDDNNEFETATSDTMQSYSKSIEILIKNIRKETKSIVRQKNDYEKLLQEHFSEIKKIKRIPYVIGTIQEVIDEENVVVKSSTGPTLLVGVSSDVDVKDLIPGFKVGLNQRHLSILEVYKSIDDPIIKSMEISAKPNANYTDIGGLNEEIVEITEIIELSLTNPEYFARIGIQPPKGVLLYGPPGTGKTLIAKAIANKTNARFISIIGSELVQKYIGEGARLVRELFSYARTNAPAIIFIDEIDTIGSKRLDIGTSGDREVQRTFMQLLAEIDGFEKLEQVKIIASTNRPEILDPALMRPGRFDRHVEITLPSAQGRLEIYSIHTRKLAMKKDVNLEYIAQLSDKFTGADIKSVCTEAGLNAIRNRRVKIRQEDFLKAIDKIIVLKTKNEYKENLSAQSYV